MKINRQRRNGGYTLVELAAAMAVGSYVAGSTPMGGGTVGFPVLVLLMDLPATLGRDFSFAIQAIGMTSASIYILCRRQELEWPMLRASLPGALLGTPLGIAFVAPLASASPRTSGEKKLSFFVYSSTRNANL